MTAAVIAYLTEQNLGCFRSFAAADCSPTMSLRVLRISSIVLRRSRFVFASNNLVRPTAQSTRFFSSETTPAVSGESAASAAKIESIVRHGSGDGVICLDVGGKRFHTLRSTIAANPVLKDIVARAEANGELTSAGNAVFVDRDPEHFHTILTYLRNKSENLSYNKKASLSMAKHYVQLPSDRSKLADLYVEATYFGIEPLQDALCNQSIFTWLASAFKGSDNPFHVVSDMLKNLRRGAIAAAGLGSVSIGILTDIKLPWSKTGDEAQKEQS